MPKDTPKPTRKPRPPKGPIVPLRPDQRPVEAIGLIQEKLIGRVVVEWSKLENCLIDLIWTLTGLNFEDGRVVTERMDPARAIAVLKILAPRYLEGEELQVLINALADVDDLRDDRNFIIHGTWSTLLPEGIPTAASIRPKSDPGIVVAEDFPASRMKAIIQKIMLTRTAIVMILKQRQNLS